VIEWLPRASDEVESDAVPPESGELPSEVAPSKNVTVPVATAGVTVAESVTLSPTTEGFGEVVTAVVVVGLFTTCVTAGDVLLWKKKFPSPPIAVMLCDPDVSADVVIDATPPGAEITWPMKLPLSKNWIGPVGVPAPGGTAVTVAVIVTGSPKFEGFGLVVTAVVVWAMFTVWV
jgi:hypothetical protein